MKASEILKEAFCFHRKGILFAKRNPDEKTSLILTYNQRLVASKITFSWGPSVSIGLDVLFLVMVVFPRVPDMVPFLIIAALSLIPALALSCLFGVLYIFAVALRAQREKEGS